MKNLKYLNGTKVLSKNEQKSINGGAKPCNFYYCPYGCDKKGVCIRVDPNL